MTGAVGVFPIDDVAPVNLDPDWGPPAMTAKPVMQRGPIVSPR